MKLAIGVSLFLALAAWAVFQVWKCICNGLSEMAEHMSDNGSAFGSEDR